ncbi:MAG: hypothetical protein ACYDEH_03265 [Acidimicrobiales bacterium]
MTERLVRARRGRLVRAAPVHRVAPVVVRGVPFRAEVMSLGTGRDAMTEHLIRAVRRVPLATALARVLVAMLVPAAATQHRDAHRDVVTIDTRPVHADPSHVVLDVPRGQLTLRWRLASEPVYTPAARAGAAWRARAR